MPKQLIYKLKIGAYKPNTIPMRRLAEYMSDLAGLLGEPQSVHFKDLEKGSTVLNVAVETEAIPKVADRVKSIGLDADSDDVKKFYDRLNKRLEQDNASGTLSSYGADNEHIADVLQFPGVDRPKPIDFGLVKERSYLDGIPMSIGGRDDTKHIQLVDGSVVYTGISLSQELSIQIMDTHCVYRKVIRLYGEGRWSRDEEGDWKLKDFKADSFEVLDPTPLRETLLQLRAIQGGSWSDVDDPMELLQDLRGHTDIDESFH